VPLPEDAREEIIIKLIVFSGGMTREQAESLLDTACATGAGMRAANQRADKAEQQLASALLKLEKERELALAEIAALKNLKKACMGTAPQKKWKGEFERTIRPEGEFMSIKVFGNLLNAYGLITKKPGAPHEGQHVFHIIANSNGGPDHTHSYLYALGGTFNISIGDRLDHLNCFLAGLEAARRAVNISIKVANDIRLHEHIELRNGKRTLYTVGAHKDITDGEKLFTKGQSLLRSIRVTARDNAQQQQPEPSN
jgi:hypothetical protein